MFLIFHPLSWPLKFCLHDGKPSDLKCTRIFMLCCGRTRGSQFGDPVCTSEAELDWQPGPEPSGHFSVLVASAAALLQRKMRRCLFSLGWSD